MSIKYKKLVPDAMAPTRATDGSGAVDLVALTMRRTPDFVEYGTGIAVEIPPGNIGFLAARSSICKYGIVLANGIGYIDSDYRGELLIRFKQVGPGRVYEIGDRVAQLTIVPIVSTDYEEVTELGSTDRGAGGFGSTGQ